MIRLLLLLQLAMASVTFGSISVNQVRCEYRENPIGIETTRPRLSWAIESSARGMRQGAYQILVASSPELLRRGQGDLWDSGKVNSRQSVQVEYGGRALVSGQACFWKVRVWDQDGNRSGWSEPARWTMGLMSSSDWKARWIGAAADSTGGDPVRAKMKELLTLEGAHWIWAPGTSYGDQPPGKIHFRRVVEIPADRKISEATFLLTADDTLQVFVNGESVGGDHRNWKTLTTRDLGPFLKPGTNVVAVTAENTGNNPAGLVGKLAIVFSDASALAIATDSLWAASAGAPAEWTVAGFNAADWKPAAEIVMFGDKHWGRIGRYVMEPAPFFRKEFRIKKPVRRATAFASALGAYELHLNGKPVGDDVLSPGWTDFNKRVHYLGYDVTGQLREGKNAIGAVLGDGWYASYLAFTGRRNYYGAEPRLIAQLNIEYEDGSREVIGTDETWKTAAGPIREADLLMGCVYDARAEQKDWSRAGFDDASWVGARVDGVARANLVAHPGEPIRPTEEIQARAVTEPKPGVYVFDLGQNMVGWVRLKVKGRAGQRVTVRHAEMLNPDGTIYTTNLRSAKQTDTFILADGSRREFEPKFTFHGFQYVEVTGLDYKPSGGDVVGVVIHSDLARAGWFECSEPLVNKLTLNSLWGQRGNFLDVPTDCPQRDERAGWTGDAQVFMKTACFNMDSAAFYTKWLADLCEDSQDARGGFGDVAPSLNVVGFGNTGWSDAGPICAWRMHEMYGDVRALERHYDSLIRHMNYLEGTSRNYRRGTGSFGDWLRLSGPQHSEVIGTAYYYYTTETMIRIARVLGKDADVERFSKLADKIREAFVAGFIKPDGRILDEKGATGQTFYALAFGLELVPVEAKERVAAQFVDSIRREKDHLATGFLGTPFVLFALQKAGQSELAYRLVLNKTYPSWLQQVIWGSTTMWERWDGWRPDKGFQDPGMNSFNHYWLGCVSEWLFTQAAGIDTEGPGFERIVIRPDFVDPKIGFSWVKARYHSIRGPVSSQWKMDEDRLSLDVTIPGNSVATVWVPARELSDVTEGGRPLDRVRDVKVLRMEDGCAVIEAGSGKYEFATRAPVR